MKHGSRNSEAPDQGARHLLGLDGGSSPASNEPGPKSERCFKRLAFGAVARLRRSSDWIKVSWRVAKSQYNFGRRPSLALSKQDSLSPCGLLFPPGGLGSCERSGKLFG
jgi:hypothetical protein